MGRADLHHIGAEEVSPRVVMSTADYYRFAEECHCNAEAALDQDVKERWQRLSKGWEALAKSTAAAGINQSRNKGETQ